MLRKERQTDSEKIVKKQQKKEIERITKNESTEWREQEMSREGDNNKKINLNKMFIKERLS